MEQFVHDPLAPQARSHFRISLSAQYYRIGDSAYFSIVPNNPAPPPSFRLSSTSYRAAFGFMSRLSSLVSVRRLCSSSLLYPLSYTGSLPQIPRLSSVNLQESRLRLSAPNLRAAVFTLSRDFSYFYQRSNTIGTHTGDYRNRPFLNTHFLIRCQSASRIT